MTEIIQRLLLMKKEALHVIGHDRDGSHTIGLSGMMRQEHAMIF
jgi:hypothetical protein